MQLARRTIESDDPGVEVARVNDVPAALFRWCWVPLPWRSALGAQPRTHDLHYVSFKWAGKIRAVIRRFEEGAPVATS